ncbi:unnamed protein product, partial [marine sediment metagenome]
MTAFAVCKVAKISSGINAVSAKALGQATRQPNSFGQSLSHQNSEEENGEKQFFYNILLFGSIGIILIIAWFIV